MYDMTGVNGSTDSETSDSDDSRQVDTLINEVAPDPDHTRRFLEESRRVTEDSLTDLLQALKTDRADEIQGVYERYRETVDMQRAIGRDTRHADGTASDYTDQYAPGDDFTPTDGKVLVPLYAWNKVRKGHMSDKASDLPGNLPAYKAVYPEPATDELTVWFNQEVEPGTADSHIYGTEETVGLWGNFDGNIPPETTEEYQAVMSDGDTTEDTPDEDNTGSEVIPVCARETANGDACRTPVKNAGDKCQHHSGDMLVDESDAYVHKESREWESDVSVDTPDGDTTEDTTEDTPDEDNPDMADLKEEIKAEVREEMKEELVNNLFN